MKLKKFLESVKYKISDGFEYQWDCFGPNAFSIGRELSVKNKFVYTADCVFDTKSQNLYEITFWDYKNNKVFRWIKKSFIKSFKAECQKKNVSFEEASDELKYTDVSFEKVISLINSVAK